MSAILRASSFSDHRAESSKYSRARAILALWRCQPRDLVHLWQRLHEVHAR